MLNRLAPRLRRAALRGAAFAVPVVALAYLVRGGVGPVIRFDQAAIRAATDLTRAHPGFRDALIIWQELFQPRWVYLVATAVCVWAWRRHGLRSRSIWAFVTMMLAWFLALQVKLLVQRARPVVDDAIEYAPGYSFPSGHAANTATATVAVLVLIWPLLTHRRRLLACVIGATIVLVTCLDRVFLGVHFPSDVTAGVLFGVGFVIASYTGYVDWSPGGEDDQPAQVEGQR